MSFSQIFDRINRFARAHAPGGFGRSREEDLRLAEELIEQERRRDERERAGANRAASQEKPDQTRLAYLQAIRILALSDGAPWEQIVLAYRREIAIHHPDRTAHLNPADQQRAHRRTQELNLAFEFLERYHGRK